MHVVVVVGLMFRSRMLELGIDGTAESVYCTGGLWTIGGSGQVFSAHLDKATEKHFDNNCSPLLLSRCVASTKHPAHYQTVVVSVLVSSPVATRTPCELSIAVSDDQYLLIAFYFWSNAPNVYKAIILSGSASVQRVFCICWQFIVPWLWHSWKTSTVLMMSFAMWDQYNLCCSLAFTYIFQRVSKDMTVFQVQVMNA